jgi:hypothetical protein
MNSQLEMHNANISVFCGFISLRAGQRLIKVELARFK